MFVMRFINNLDIKTRFAAIEKDRGGRDATGDDATPPYRGSIPEKPRDREWKKEMVRPSGTSRCHTMPINLIV